MPELSCRRLHLIGLLTCIAAMAFAVGFLQHYLYLEPCPLCVITRVIVISMGLVFLLAWLHNPAATGQRVYAGLLLLIGLSGLGVQIRHIWLQNLPPDEVPACGPGLDYLLDTLPLFTVLKQVFQGSGECAEIDWSFLGLSIPMQTALLFVFLLAVVLLIFRCAKQRSSFR